MGECNYAYRKHLSGGGINAKYTPAKKIDIGNAYMILLYGVQPTKGSDGRVATDDISEQTKQVLGEISQILTAAGAGLDDVVKTVIYLTDMNDMATVSDIRAEYFKHSMPVSTVVEVNRMTRGGTKIEIEVTAIKQK